MNKDQVKGTVKQAAGRIQEQTGKFVGSHFQQAKGLGRQVSGQIHKSVDDVKEYVKDVLKKH